MDFTYQQNKDGMLVPSLQISEDIGMDQIPAGSYGRQWKEYMMEKHPHRLSELIARGRLNQTITEVDEAAENRKEMLVQELLKAQPMLDTEDTLKRAAHMEMITLTAEEVILSEVVFRIR